MLSELQSLLTAHGQPYWVMPSWQVSAQLPKASSIPTLTYCQGLLSGLLKSDRDSCSSEQKHPGSIPPLAWVSIWATYAAGKHSKEGKGVSNIFIASLNALPVPVRNHISSIKPQVLNSENETEEPRKLLWNLAEELSSCSPTLQDEREEGSDSTGEPVRLCHQSVTKEARPQPLCSDQAVGRTQQHKCLIIFVKTFSSNSNLVPYRHISGAHPPITRSKGNRALNVIKNKLSVREGEIIIYFQKNKTLGSLFHSIWCQHFRNKPTEVVWIWFLSLKNSFLCLAVSGIMMGSTITRNKVCLYCHKYFAKTEKVEYFVLCRSCKYWVKRDPGISVLKSISNSLCISCALSNPLNVKSPTQFC